MAIIIQWPYHKWYSCPPGKAACIEGRCQYCEGGLSFCVVCKAGEAELPTHCLGKPMSAFQKNAVSTGCWDYQKGSWIRLDQRKR